MSKTLEKDKSDEQILLDAAAADAGDTYTYDDYEDGGEDGEAQSRTVVPSAFLTIWKEVMRDKVALVGVILFTVIMIGTFVWSFAIDQPTARRVSLPARNQAPSAAFPWGTDQSGRSVQTELVLGARNTILVAFSVTLVAGLIGMVIGLLSGFYGGRIDNIVMRCVDTWSMLPGLMLIIVVVSIIPEYSPVNFVLILSAFNWMATCRMIRAMALQQSNLDFVHASKTLGTRNIIIMLREVLPNLIPVITVNLTLALAANMGVETTLTFLGYGLPHGTPSLGALIAHARQPYALQNRLWQWLPAAALVFILMLCVFSIGLALNRASNVRQRRA